MRARSIALPAILILAGSLGFAKGKAKDALPPYVLRAHTVSVIIDPDAGMAIDDPNANQVARRDVEAALQSWGRFEPVLAGQPADLVIVIRRGHQRLVSDTMPDPRQNDRIGGINSSNDGMQVGGRQGNSAPQSPGPPGSSFPQNPSTPQTEIGGQDDSFAVYDGSVARPLDAPPAWRSTSPNGLQPHAVPAVAQFRKAIAAAEKAANQP